MSESLLVAGVGNIFLGDDGFGVEVAQRLSRQPAPNGATIADFGIRGVHLAYELLDGYDVLILIDAAPRGEEPGTVSVLELDTAEGVPPGEAAAPMDAHGMDPETVFGTLRQLGGRLDHAYVVGCEPADVTEGIGLSEPVERALDSAVKTVLDLVEQVSAPTRESVRTTGETGRER